MVGPPRLTRRNAQFVRSQFAMELFLWLYAVASALLLFRLVLKLLSVSDRVWTARVVYGASDLLVWPLTLLPGADRTLVSAAGLADFTAVAILCLIPLTFSLGRKRRIDG